MLDARLGPAGSLGCLFYRPITRQEFAPQSGASTKGLTTPETSRPYHPKSRPYHPKSLLARFILCIGKRLLNHRQLRRLPRPPSSREAVNISLTLSVWRCIRYICTMSVFEAFHSTHREIVYICAALTSSTLQTHAEEHLRGEREDAIGLLKRARQAAIGRRR